MSQDFDPQTFADSITPQQRKALVGIIQPILDIYKRVANAYLAALKPIARALTEPPSDLQLARRDIRRIGARESSAAHAWLDQHLDDMYADLGLERPR